MSSRILFLTLRVFSATGGIEKMCRIAGKALQEYAWRTNVPFTLLSMHDVASEADGNIYFPAESFNGYGAAKSRFMFDAVKCGKKSGTVILSHANLLPAGWLIKRSSPQTKLILIAHGIEIWKPLSRMKLKMLRACDEIICVSNFTAGRVQELHGIPAARCTVLNNCIDPFMPAPATRLKNKELLQRYNFSAQDKIIFTLARLNSKERYKGYNHVLSAMAVLVKKNPAVKYLLAGKYDEEEKKYVEDLVVAHGIENNVVLSGFIPDEELPMHFSMADLYVMPSMKEGFGIVFVEAMNYGLPVIAGNADGSADALLNGYLGLLIRPDSPAEIEQAIETMLADPAAYAPDHELLMAHFGYDAYKRNLETILN